MKVLGLIPARAGSKGVPSKNIKAFAGKSLVEWTYEIARKSEAFDRIILSTDSDELLAMAKIFGLDAPFKRPKNISHDEAPMIDVVLHAVDKLKTDGYIPDAIMILQPTSPFRTKRLINEAIQTLIEKNSDAVCSVTEVPEEYNPFRMMWLKGESLTFVTTEGHLIRRRQDAPRGLKRDGNIYLTKINTLIKYKNLYGERCIPIFSSSDEEASIDTTLDWQLAEERFINKLNKRN